jgi:hypothetical protein
MEGKMNEIKLDLELQTMTLSQFVEKSNTLSKKFRKDENN